MCVCIVYIVCVFIRKWWVFNRWFFVTVCIWTLRELKKWHREWEQVEWKKRGQFRTFTVIFAYSFIRWIWRSKRSERNLCKKMNKAAKEMLTTPMGHKHIGCCYFSYYMLSTLSKCFHSVWVFVHVCVRFLTLFLSRSFVRFIKVLGLY